MPQLFWDTGSSSREVVADAQGSQGVKPISEEIRSDTSITRRLPMGGYVGIASNRDTWPDKYEKVLVDRQATVMERVFNVSPPILFSAVIDAMISLNMPVETVDSPNAVITSDWIRKGENDVNIQSVLGFTRHRFFVRMIMTEASETRLEVHVAGQHYKDNAWVDKALTINKSEELFVAVEEQLAKMPRRGSASGQ
ncbi:hypothetical protein [Mariprofundus micogutta]|nr:hypothetical protein [Mariprofundus micogutta]